MTSFIKKIKSLAFVIMAFSFLLAVTVSSCTPKDKGSEDTDSVEVVEAADSEEHPTDSLSAASEGEEHPSESEDKDGEEHPTEGEEEEEHPTEENQ